jgi:2,4-dienoyl-CoA reductase-like NADH-dependent reductase (Old Yellow Enzyme family)
MAAPGSLAAASGARDRYVLFSPGRIAGLSLTNRLVRTATAENAWRGAGISEEGIELYRDLAAGGVGLIITGYMAVMPEGRAGELQTRLWEDRHIPAVRHLARVVRETNPACRVVAQIAHAGMQTQAAEPVGPTETAWPRLKTRPRALATREVETVVAAFAQAIRRAREAGFDGVELHGAHGYLLSSFLSPYTNTRTDRYGGSVERRVTVVREIVAQARPLVGPAFPILIRMNGDDHVAGGIDLDRLPELARQIEKAGVQAVDLSGNNAARQNLSSPEQESYYLKHAQALRLKIPVIATGGNRSVERLEQAAKTGGPEFFGFARPLVREPDLPRRWREGRGPAVAACISCSRCMRGFNQGLPTRCRVGEANL